MERTKPRFKVNTIVKTPIHICESMKGRICGCEWGPDNKHLQAKFAGWVYTLREVRLDGIEVIPEAGSGMGFLASERELSEWQRAKS